MSSSRPLTQKVADEVASDLKCMAVRGDLHTLMLDLDSPSAVVQYDAMLSLVQSHLPIVETDRWTSKSGNGLHVLLTCSYALQIRDILLLQLVLGSDPRREFLSLLSILNNESQLNYLFKPLQVTE